ncbi:MAG TPA: DUF255 domain-containing protein [Verrucomicrobiae bacterium]|nr:DUF255 domain-containing protein [Verrucomicrobiae bacterium]
MLRFSPNPNLAQLVHWLEWERDAFRRAHQQDKPVMLFLSAFWCRYCQRMDEGAFSDRENMALLNAYFVALRVENAMRPDIDARYNLNGWPTVAFFTPAGELLAAVNYLGADEFKELLLNVYMDYQEKKTENRVTKAPDDSEAVVARQAEREPAGVSALTEITNGVMALADRFHGGYGQGQKFIHAEANDFLLRRYAATKDAAYLDHVRLTLDRMRESPIYDDKDGGYFRTTSGADWVQPHREKLLGEQAGLLSNCLYALRFTQRREYARMAEEIIGYLDRKLFDPSSGAFFGCEDFLRRETNADTSADEFFTIIDQCVYTDANAQAISAYLDAAAILGRADCKERALNVLEFLWSHSRSPTEGMYHYYDGAPHVQGLLDDQARMGAALVEAYHASGEAAYLERARELAEFILARLRNPEGGYFDLGTGELGFLKFRLTAIEQNGATAFFLLKLAQAGREPKYFDAADWALRAFSGNFASCGIHAAPFGRALGEWLNRR